MKKLFKGFMMSFGMFCAIPIPYKKWDEQCVRLMLPTFPFVGVIIGALWFGLTSLLNWRDAPLMLKTACVFLFPYIVTGFIHLDGFMDTQDAMMSRKPREDKIRILKDPHTGAFGVISLVCLFFLSFSGTYSMLETKTNFQLLFLVPILSRCLSALALMNIRTLASSGYGTMFKKETNLAHTVFVIVIAALTLVAGFLTGGWTGLFVLLSVIIGAVVAFAITVKDLGGISGDLCGHALTVSELCGLIALAVL